MKEDKKTPEEHLDSILEKINILLGRYADLSRRHSELRQAVEETVIDLRETKSIAKSVKIAQIRENLEMALGRKSEPLKSTKLSKDEEDAIFDECHLY